MDKKLAWGIAAIIVVILGIVWVARMQNAPGPAAPAAPSEETAPATTTATTTPPAPVAPAPAAKKPAPSSGSPVAAPLVHRVSIRNFAFVPATITVKRGDTVVWTNNDSVPHSVTGDGGDIASPTLKPGQSYSFKFTAGDTSFIYHCGFHPSMTGKVVVERVYP